MLKFERKKASQTYIMDEKRNINQLRISPKIIKSLHKKSQYFDYEDFIKNEKNQKNDKNAENRQKNIKKIEKKLNFVKNCFIF